MRSPSPYRPPEVGPVSADWLPIRVSTYTYIWAAAGLVAGVAAFLVVVGLQVMSELGHRTPITDTRLEMKRALGDLSLYAAKRDGAYPSSREELEVAQRYFRGGRFPRDGWGRPMLYIATPDGPALLSLGADGALGGTDAAADIVVHATPQRAGKQHVMRMQ